MRDWALPVEDWHATANCSCPRDITPIIRLCGGNLFVEDPLKIREGSRSLSTYFCFLNGQFTQTRVTARCYPAGLSNCGCGKTVTLQSPHKRRRLDLFTPLLGQLSPAVQPCISIFESLQICTSCPKLWRDKSQPSSSLDGTKSTSMVSFLSRLKLQGNICLSNCYTKCRRCYSDVLFSISSQVMSFLE